MNPDIQRGREALSYFHTSSVSYKPYVFKSSTDLENALGGAPFTEGLGLTANSIDLSVTELREAMVNFARQAQGRMPTNKYSFYKALSDHAQNFSFFNAAKYTAVETAKDLGKGAQVVGESLIQVGKGLFGILPVLVVGGAIMYVYFRVKK